MSPALEGRFLTTVPPGSPISHLLTVKDVARCPQSHYLLTAKLEDKPISLDPEGHACVVERQNIHPESREVLPTHKTVNIVC